MRRRRVLGSVIALVIGLASPALAQVAAPRALPRPRPAAAPIAAVNSIWVWQSRPAADLADQAQALDVTRVYLFVGGASRTGDRRIRRSVAMLHAEGVSVFALSGQPGWALHHAPAIRWANRALALAPFDGLHLDVEPYSLKSWKSHQQADIAAYLGLLDALGPLAGTLDVDVQFAMGKIVTPGGTFGGDILARVDGVTVMSYRDTAFGNNSMWEISQDWLDRAATANVPVWLSAETNPVPGCSYCTFAEDGQADMATVLGQVDAAARSADPTYQGFAIEDLDGWLALGP